jgi:hypothetical protein
VTPVDQTTFGPGKGNCFSACVASVLDLTIEEVPFFMGSEDWVSALLLWCEQNGVDADFSTEFPAPAGDYVIVGGGSPRYSSVGHAVVWLDGQLAHDPHPDRTGIVGEPWDWIRLTRRGAL